MSGLLNFVSYHPLASIGLIALLLSFISRQIRTFIAYLLSNIIFLFVRRTYLRRSLGDALVKYLMTNNYKVKRFSGELYGEDPAFIRSENEVRQVLYRDFHNGFQMFYGKGWPILLSGTPLIHKQDAIRSYEYIVYSFRWSNKILSLLDGATEFKNNDLDDGGLEIDNFKVKRVSGGRFIQEKNRDGGDNARLREIDNISEELMKDPFSSVLPIKWDKNNIGQLVYHNTMSMMSLNPELEDVLEEIKFWFNSRQWYEDRGIPWKRGYLWFGDPGTGKSLFTRALAEELNIPLISFDLASMNNQEFVSAWNQILPKRIILFEDFDNVFHGRKNVANGDLTFDCILNTIDGVDKSVGKLLVVTTNHPELLDPAMGGPETIEQLKNNEMPKRPGRIDRSVKFVKLNKEGRIKLVKRIVKDDTLTERIVEEGKNDTAAQLQERAFRIAIEILFNSTRKKSS